MSAVVLTKKDLVVVYGRLENLFQASIYILIIG